MLQAIKVKYNIILYGPAEIKITNSIAFEFDNSPKIIEDFYARYLNKLQPQTGTKRRKKNRCA